MADGTVIDMPYGGGCSTEIANIDLLRIIEKLDRWAQELACCQSADLNGGLAAGNDAGREDDYLADFRAFVEFVIEKPIPDMPETHGRVRDSVPAPFPEMPGITDIENGDVRQVLRQMRGYRVEVTRCQSARLVVGFLAFDKTRFLDGLTRIENELEYAKAHEPSDFPETTPSEPPVPSGK